MASSTFYHLPTEKKQRIIQAVIHEFTRVSFSEASINKIINEAGISRGSFYQYFDDKYDCLEAIMEYFKKEADTYLLHCLQQHQGEVFETLEIIFDAILKLLSKKETRIFYENLFNDAKLSHRYVQGLIFEPNSTRARLMSEVNLSHLIIDESQLADFLEILYSVMIQSIRDIFFCGNNHSLVKEKFHKKIVLLKQAYEKGDSYVGA